uniref:Uncharacterized protein n=1 Tax=Arundo donax TaxID=35708 RepID=A0A0A9AHV6_ARUDO
MDWYNSCWFMDWRRRIHRNPAPPVESTPPPSLESLVSGLPLPLKAFSSIFKYSSHGTCI